MGGLLGGGSSINFMMYTRAQGIDFDSWATEGWAAKDMLPLCRKLETFHPLPGQELDPEIHGTDGPIHVSDGGYRGKSEEEFMRTVEGMGYRGIEDLQTLEENGGFAVSSFPFLQIWEEKAWRTDVMGRNGNAMSAQTVNDKIQLIDIFTPFCKTASTPISRSSLSQRSSVCSSTILPLLAPLASNTSPTPASSLKSHSPSPHPPTRHSWPPSSSS